MPGKLSPLTSIEDHPVGIVRAEFSLATKTPSLDTVWIDTEIGGNFLPYGFNRLGLVSVWPVASGVPVSHSLRLKGCRNTSGPC